MGRSPETRTLIEPRVESLSMRPATLLLQTEGDCKIDPEHLLEMFGGKGNCSFAVLRGFGPDDWVAQPGAPTGRLTTWSAIFCDANALFTRACRRTRARSRSPVSTRESRLVSG